MAILVDDSTPAVVRSASVSATATITTSTFTPPTGSLMVGVGICEYSATATSPTMSISDTASGVWFSRARAADNIYSQSQIWTQYISDTPGDITVTFNRGGSIAASASLYVAVLTGASSNQGGAGITQVNNVGPVANAEQSSTVNVLESWVYVGAAYSNSGTWSPDANTTSIDVWSDTNNLSTNLIGRATVATASIGFKTLGWTRSPAGSQDVAFVAVEIVPLITSDAIRVGAKPIQLGG